MAAKKNKTRVKSTNLLEISEIERIKILKDLRESFKQKNCLRENVEIPLRT